MFYCSALYYCKLQHNTIHCITLRYRTVPILTQYTTIPYIALCCMSLHYSITQVVWSQYSAPDLSLSNPSGSQRNLTHLIYLPNADIYINILLGLSEEFLQITKFCQRQTKGIVLVFIFLVEGGILELVIPQHVELKAMVNKVPSTQNTFCE